MYNMMQEQYRRLPPGFRFIPTEVELINEYLKKKINDEAIPWDLIPSVDVYKHNPHELADAYPSFGREDEWYFFTRRDRKYPRGTRPNRAAGNGYWKATIADRKIYDDNVCIGSKRCLVFHEGKAPKGKKSDWIMYEYMANLPPTQPNDTNDTRLDYVLCRIYKTKRSDSKCRKSMEAESNCDQNDENQKRPKTTTHEEGSSSDQHQNHHLAGEQSIPLLVQQNVEAQSSTVEPTYDPMNFLRQQQHIAEQSYPQTTHDLIINFPMEQHNPLFTLESFNQQRYPKATHLMNLPMQQQNWFFTQESTIIQNQNLPEQSFLQTTHPFSLPMQQEDVLFTPPSLPLVQQQSLQNNLQAANHNFFGSEAEQAESTPSVDQFVSDLDQFLKDVALEQIEWTPNDTEIHQPNASPNNLQAANHRTDFAGSEPEQIDSTPSEQEFDFLDDFYKNLSPDDSDDWFADNGSWIHGLHHSSQCS